MSVKKLTEDDISVGDHIEITKGRAGEVKFKGKVHYAEGIHFGIELIGSVGKHSGSWRGKKYFDCATDRGMLVQMDRVRKKIPNPHKQVSGKGGSSRDLSKIGYSKKNLGIEEKDEEEVEESKYADWQDWDPSEVKKYVNETIKGGGEHFEAAGITGQQLGSMTKNDLKEFCSKKNIQGAKTLLRYMKNDFHSEK